MPRPPKQHAPVKFGEPFNPKSVEGVRAARAERAETRRWKDLQAERLAAAEAARPLRAVLWEKMKGLVVRAGKP